MDDLALRRARATRWLPSPLLSSLDEAGRFIDALGFALLFPAERIELPSLWEAVAGEDVEPFASGMGEAESRVWEWKDELSRHGLAWYGKLLHRRGSLLAPEVLAALYPGRGRTDDHVGLDLSREARSIAAALAGGPLTTAALREIVGDRSRYERAMTELYRAVLVTSAGVEQQRTGWPAGLIDLTCRRFPVGGGRDPSQAARRFLDTSVFTTARSLARAYGWTLADARLELDRLTTAGAATRSVPARPSALGAHPPSGSGSVASRLGSGRDVYLTTAPY